jgi:hypothetical protein
MQGREQERFDHFIRVYNHQRPHQALGGAYPGDIYTPSVRVYHPPPDPEYPYHDRTVRVTRCGRICFGRLKDNLSNVFSGQLVGLREVEGQVWLVSFLDYDLGFFDTEKGRVEPAPNPFVPDRVLTMCPEWTVALAAACRLAGDLTAMTGLRRLRERLQQRRTPTQLHPVPFKRRLRDRNHQCRDSPSAECSGCGGRGCRGRT